MEGYMPGAECSECKGKCCKDKGCSLSPQDMLREIAIYSGQEKSSNKDTVGSMDKEELYHALLSLLQDTEKGIYAIDYISMPDGACYYLRMRHKCYTYIGVDAMGECIALTKTGCMLEPERRPKGGRFLESHPGGQCTQHYTREQLYEDWIPYQDVLGRIWKEYYPKMKADGTFDRCDVDYFSWMKEQREGKQ